MTYRKYQKTHISFKGPWLPQPRLCPLRVSLCTADCLSWVYRRFTQYAGTSKKWTTGNIQPHSNTIIHSTNIYPTPTTDFLPTNFFFLHLGKLVTIAFSGKCITVGLLIQRLADLNDHNIILGSATCPHLFWLD